MRLTNLAFVFLLWLLCFVNDGAAHVKQLPECKMEEFRSTFFHAVGRRGFVRVRMEGRTLKQMNREIDEILGDQDDENCVP
uniref:Secreted protein n=1 Tax=Steinernema glaseri TaxID=37863 RepID=A0A1I7Y8D5_9BILA